MNDTSRRAVDRTPTAFGDLRGWIEALRSAKEIAEIDQEVHWDVELGTIVRMAQGTGYGPAFLFNNITDYNRPDSLCSQVFTGGQGSFPRLSMMFGLPKDTPVRELVKVCRTIFSERVAPVTVDTGPVKQNILKGDDIDLLKFPV